jgi:hypothetical protein
VYVISSELRCISSEGRAPLGKDFDFSKKDGR